MFKSRDLYFTRGLLLCVVLLYICLTALATSYFSDYNFHTLPVTYLNVNFLLRVENILFPPQPNKLFKNTYDSKMQHKHKCSFNINPKTSDIRVKTLTGDILLLYEYFYF